MSSNRVDTLSDNSYGVLGQPVYLVVVLLVVAAIITIFSVSLQHSINDVQIHHVEQEIDRIMTEAANMYEYADEGTVITLHVSFPGSLRCLVFGALPTNGTMEPTNRTLDEHANNNYYYIMNDGTLRLFHSNARFSSKNLTQIAVFRSGTYDLTLALCYLEGNTYVTMY